MLLAAANDSTQHIIEIGVIESLIGAGIVGTCLWIVRSAKGQISEWADNLMHEVKPNGGTTASNGDTTKRTEIGTKRIEALLGVIDAKVDRVDTKVDSLVEKVATQKGHTDAVETEIFNRLGTLEKTK